MKRTLILSVILTLLGALGGCAQSLSEQAEKLFDQFKKAARFDYNYPREKVYVHIDNSSYYVGDTIWYKAYVVRASSLKPTTLSKVLYVELRNADGQEIVKQTLLLDSLGATNGAIVLPNFAYSGYYEILAYTREMVNWGKYAYYSRVIPIFTASNPMRKQKKDLDLELSKLSIFSPTERKYPTVGLPRPYIMTNNKQHLLNFYPEGGNRTKGVSQRIAYKLTDGTGLPTEDSIKVYNADGRLYTITIPEYDGMGTFELPADFTDGYAIVGKEKKHFALPLCGAQYYMRVESQGDGINVSVKAEESVCRLNSLLGLAILNRENASYFDTLTVKDSGTDIFIPNQSIRGGVNRIELFDITGKSLSTRLFWRYFTQKEQERMIKLEVKQNAEIYAPFSPAVVKLHAKDANGRALKNVSMSVSVRDEHGNWTETADGGMGADLLLASEIRGYIHRPESYFEREDAAHKRMLDLLLMVQGWSANTFDVMCQRDSFKLEQPIEDKYIIKGSIFSYNNQRRPMANVKIDMKAYGFENDKMTGSAIEGTTVTDSLGHFAFAASANIQGQYLARFCLNDTINDKRRWSKLLIDRWFCPPLRPLTEQQMIIHPYQGKVVVAEKNNNTHLSYSPDLFEWKDTIVKYKVSTLHTAEVKAKRKYKGFTGTRYTWGGGVASAIRVSLTYFDVQKECERFRDCGVNDINIFEFLNMMYSKYDAEDACSNRSLKGTTIVNFDLSNLTDLKGIHDKIQDINEEDVIFDSNEKRCFFIDGHGYRVFLNNEEIGKELDDPNNTSCKDFSAVTLVKGEYREDNLTGKLIHACVGKAFSSKEKFADFISLHEAPSDYRTRSKKGVEYRHIQGFNREVKFYSPNYRHFDMPTEHDVRRTLYWNPQVTTDANGEANVIFFTNSREGLTLDISVRGITKDGQLIDWN